MRRELDRYEVDEHGCWVWQGHLNKKGYASLGGAWARNTGRSILAYRVSWEDANDAVVPKGYSIDHLCRNRACIRPDHLESVPHYINIQRGNRAKLNEHMVQSIIRHASEGKSTTAIARAHGICPGTAQGIKYGHSWPHVSSSYRSKVETIGRGRGGRVGGMGKSSEVVIPYPPGQAL